MQAKNDFKTTNFTKSTKNDKKKIKKIEKNFEKKKSNQKKATILQKDIKLAKEDRMLEKIEKYVDKNREKTSQEIIERKRKRPDKNFQEGDLEVMISRISIDSKPKERTKEVSKRILYIIYAIIFIVGLIFIIKYFFVGNIPQN